jgi:hypothetical protein
MPSGSALLITTYVLDTAQPGTDLKSVPYPQQEGTDFKSVPGKAARTDTEFISDRSLDEARGIREIIKTPPAGITAASD